MDKAIAFVFDETSLDAWEVDRCLTSVARVWKRVACASNRASKALGSSIVGSVSEVQHVGIKLETSGQDLWVDKTLCCLSRRVLGTLLLEQRVKLLIIKRVGASKILSYYQQMLLFGCNLIGSL